jgi:hypothetical protein
MTLHRGELVSVLSAVQLNCPVRELRGEVADNSLPQRLFEFSQSLQPIDTLIELSGIGTDFSGCGTLATLYQNRISLLPRHDKGQREGSIFWMRNGIPRLKCIQGCGLHSPSTLHQDGLAILARQLLAHTIQEVLDRLKLRTRQLKLAPNCQFGPSTNVYRPSLSNSPRIIPSVSP